MLIKLYEDCILTPDYEYVVAAHSFPKSNWEETVAKFSADIYVDNVCYATDNEHAGQFIVEVNQQGYDTPIYTRVNYCQMYPYVNLGQSTHQEFCINCFITDVSIYNNIVTFKFLEDIFMNYMYKTHSNSSDVPKLNNVLITQKTFASVPTNACNVRLPVDPYSNKPPKLTPIPSVNNYVTVALKIQRYKTGQAGSVNSRESISVIACTANTEETTMTGIKTWGSVASLVYDLNKMLYLQGVAGSFSDGYNFNIAEIVVIPCSAFGTELQRFVSYEQGYIIKDDINKFYFAEFLDKVDTSSDLLWFKSFDVFDYITDPNDKFYVTGVGFLSKIIPVSYNGKPLEIKLGLSVDDFSITLYLGVNGSLYDVTDIFTIDIPYDYENAEALQLQGLKRELNSANIDLSEKYLTDTMITNVVTGSAKAGVSMLGGFLSGGVGGILGGIGTGIGNIGEVANAGISYQYRSDQLVNDRKLNNAPLFSGSKITPVYNSSIYALFVGFIIQSIEPDYKEIINAMVNQYGYKCVEYQSTFILEQVPLKNGRGFVQIEYCEISGPKIITDVIKRVFKKGVKVIGYYEV